MKWRRLTVVCLCLCLASSLTLFSGEAGGDSDPLSGATPDVPSDKQDTHEGEVLHVKLALDAAKPSGAGPLTALALSGGGSSGAFGAGFLKGWGQRTDQPRPSFDVVTGTSTGALIATFAFLGSFTCGGEPCDQQIIDQYLALQKDDDVFSNRFFLKLLWKNSITTRDQFRARLDKAITNEMVTRVGEEGTHGRLLLVGATDMLSGRFHYFDLTRLAKLFNRQTSAAEKEKLRQEYVDKLMASSAVPVQFPPLWLQDSPSWRPSLYADGGARRNVFLEGLKTFAKEQGRDFSVYCILNGARGVDKVKYTDINHGVKIVHMATRSVEILLDESTEGNLFRIYLELQAAGQKGEFFFVSVPPGDAERCAAMTAPPGAQFSYPAMKCLSEVGGRIATSDLSKMWQTNPLEDSY